MRRKNTKHYFGACPHCADASETLNLGRDHYMVCHAHKAYWVIGSNLFSSWRYEDKSVWDRNRQTLATYSEVEPLPYIEPFSQRVKDWRRAMLSLLRSPFKKKPGFASDEEIPF